jgi:hypothetical protein
MTTSFVGLENLPNVYFRDISVLTISDQLQSLKVDIKLIVKDTKIDGNFQWVNNDLLNTYLNIKIVQSLDKDFTGEISNGIYTLQAFDYRKSANYEPDLVNEQLMRLRVKDDPELYAVGDDVYEFEYSFSFNVVASNIADVAYFACISLDVETLGVDFSANFDEEQIKYFQGPISSEKVFVDGALQTKTNVFYLPDNKLWSGPVHLHEGKYMAGAFHDSRPHPTLRQEEIQNLKLKDNRVKILQSKKENAIKESILIGTPYDTMDEEGNVKRLFSFNIESIFLEKTKYGSIIKQIDTNLYNSTIENFKIYKLLIKRKFVKRVNKKNDFKIFNSRTENCLIFQDNDETTIIYEDDCGLTEVMGTNKKYRYFNFIDKKIKSLKYGNYIHSVDLSFVDKTKDLLISLLEKYRTDISDLQRYYIRASKTKNKTINQSFDKRFMENEYQLYDLKNPDNSNLVPWLRGPENYANLSSYLFSLTDVEKAEIYEKYYKLINPDTGTPTGISLFIEDYNSLINEFNNKFDIQKIIKGTYDSRFIPRKTGTDNPSIYVRLQEDYEEIFAPVVDEPGYRIFEKQEPEDNQGLPVFNRSDFDARRVEEKNRFFATNPNLNFEESKNLDADEVASLTDIETYSTAYFSPIKFILGSRRVDLRQTDVINNKLLNDTVNIALKRKKRRKKRSIFSKNASINKLKNAPNQPVSNDQEKSFQNASDYVGETSKFLNLSSEFSSEEMDLIDKILVREKFLTSKNKKVKRKLIKSFDLTKKDNVIFRKKRASSTGSTKAKKRKLAKRFRKQLRKMPNHLKAVVSSRSSAVRTNLLSSVTDLLATEEQNNGLLMQHFAVQQIEYLDGFKKDKKGNEIFNFPEWKQLDLNHFKENPNKILICRATQYVDELLDLTLPEDLDFQLFDKYFIILPESTTTEKTLEKGFAFNTATTMNTERGINYDYATTNPVNQSAKENGIFTSPPEPNKPLLDIETSTRNRRRNARSTTSSGGGY